MADDFMKVVNKNLPGIFTTISIISTAVTAVYAVKAGMDIKEELDALPEGTDTLDKVKVALPHLAPVGIGVVVSAGTAYAAHHEHTKRYMALASTAAILQKDNKYLQQFKQKAEEKLGVKKVEGLKDGLAKQEANKVSTTLGLQNDAMVWFHDLETGHIFKSTFLRLQRARDDYNEECKICPRPIMVLYMKIQGDEYQPTPLHEYIGIGNERVPALIFTFGSELADDMSQIYTISYDHCDMHDVPDDRLIYME